MKYKLLKYNKIIKHKILPMIHLRKNIIKIDYIGFYNSYKYFDEWITIFNLLNIKVEHCDCSKEECDIVFRSVFKPIKMYIGNPIIILVTGEYRLGYYDNGNVIPFKYDYSFSFYNDSETNLYYPHWQKFFNRYLDNNIQDKNYLFNQKNKFCTFIVGNPSSICGQNLATRRIELFKYISDNYKQIDGCGGVCNTIGYNLSRNIKDASIFHIPYKFNLCFENQISSGNISYITEKILHAYAYNTIPIYMGSENITKWFNPKSFINCNGLSNEEILKKVIEIDTDDNKYFNMLNEYPTIEKINYYNYSLERVKQFILKICEENNLI